MSHASPRLRTAVLVLTAVHLVAGCGSAPERRTLDTRAVVVGIDGADWRVIDALVEEGGMPNLQELRRRGIWGPLATLDDIPLSPVIWTSIATGKSAKKHGVTWFMVDRPDGTRVPVRSHNRQVKAIWNLLAESGASASVVGWWATYPAEEIGAGAVVSDGLGYHGFGSTARRDDDAGKTWPPELYSEVAPLMPPLPSISYGFARRFLHLAPESWEAERFTAASAAPDPQNPVHLFQQYAATALGYAAISERLLGRGDDLHMVYFEQVDSFSHLFMKYAPPRLEWIDAAEQERYKDVVAEWYRYQDELLGRLLAKIDLETTAVFVVSDHGFKSGGRRIHSEQAVDVRRAHLDHERDGIFLAAGPHIRRGEQIRGGSVLDVTPTLLYYLGLPVGRDMDGKVLEQVFDESFRDAHEVRWVATWEDAAAPPPVNVAAVEKELSPEELAAAKKALATLGYLGGTEGGVEMPEAGESSPGESSPGESSPEIHNNLGRVHLRDGELDAARAEFEQALTLDPRNAEALLNLASIHRVEGRVAQAEHLVRRALQVDPSSIAALAQLAEVKRAQGDLGESIRLFEEAMKVDDSQPFLYLGLGDSLNRAGRYEEAEAAFRTVIGLDPDSFEAYYDLGVTFLARRRLDEAEREFERALKLDPSHVHAAEAWNNLGDIHLRRGEREVALEQFRKAAEASPFHLESRYNLGVLYLQGGEPAAAVARLEEAAALAPDHEQVNASLGMAYLLAGRNEDAHRSFLLVRRLYPNNWVASLGLALLHAGAGQRDEARKLLGDAFESGGAAARAEAGNYPLLEGILAGMGESARDL